MPDRSPPAGPTALAAAAGLEICLFGPMEVRIGPHPVPRLRTRKGLWLLALLALRSGRPVERDWLAGTLWPDDDTAHSRRSLRQSLHDLRRTLGPEARRLMDDSPRALRLEVAGAAVDVLAFDAAMARRDLDSLSAALPLYRGPLLEGCTEEWCLEERRQREETYVAALERLAAAAAARREPTAAASYLRRAVGADPYREDLLCALMRALAEGGNPAAALLAYEQFRALLRREMAAAPAEETTALFRRLREDTCPRARPPCRSSPRSPGSRIATAPRGRLPLPLTALIGRDEAVREITAQLTEARLVTLTGPGGIGKTRLAIQVAAGLEGQFEDGVIFVDLAPLADPEAVPDVLRAALAVSPGNASRDTVEALRHRLASRRLLLVLDNCEHLLSACAALAQTLLCHCSGLRLLVTSRQPLGLPGETIWRVPSLSVPGVQGFRCSGVQEGSKARPEYRNTRTPEHLLQYAAVRLFLGRARATEASFEMTAQNAPAISRICRQLDGIPLAIELAAAWVRSLSVEEIGARLQEGFELLRDGSSGRPPRQQTMAATLDWSWDLLSPAEHALLRRLSVFAGGWTLAAAEAVCGDYNEEVLDLLTSLVNRSLVVYLSPESQDRALVSAGSASRYRLLEPVRQYAAGRLGQSDDGEAIRNRHRDFFLEWAEAVRPKLSGTAQAWWFGALEAEHDNLRAALDWCRARGDTEKELRLAVALSRFWDTRGHLREGRAHLEAALGRMTPEVPLSLRLEALGHAGWMASVQRDHLAARGYYDQVLAGSRQQGDHSRTARVLNVLALVLMDQGDIPAAQVHFEESLALYRKLGETGHAVLSNLGVLALRQAHYEAARDYLEQSASLCEIVGDRQEHGLVRCNLSWVYLVQGRHEEARAHGAAGLRLLHDCGAVINLPAALEQMARVAQAQAEWERAARLLGAAEGLRDAAGLPSDTAAERVEARAAAERALGADVFAAAFAEGEAMELEQAVACALREEEPD